MKVYKGKTLKECVAQHMKENGYPFSDGNLDSIIFYLKMGCYCNCTHMHKDGKYFLVEK